MGLKNRQVLEKIKKFIFRNDLCGKKNYSNLIKFSFYIFFFQNYENLIMWYYRVDL